VTAALAQAPGGVAAARAASAALKKGWRRGEPPDAAAALAAHPTLARFKSVVLDLAYEEFLIREQGGERPEVGAFAERFPGHRASVRYMLDAHRLLAEQPELLDPAAAAWPEAGEQVEGLDLLAELGRGAFGRAYLAFDTSTSRLCALKVAAGGAAEAQVIGRLAHPHVTDLYWARPVGGRTAVCMPFVGVSTLADVIAAAFSGGAVPPSAGVILRAAEADGLAGEADRRSAPVVRPEEPYVIGACAVAARIADAVAYLHRMTVFHGDLKPSNVVVGPGGAPHLIDFNLAADSDPVVVRGTPAYMAPELLAAAKAGRSARGIDAARADLFALGCVVYELLTGRHPFPPGTPGAPPAPSGVPAAVAGVVLACLSADPAARPASARVVAAALDRFVRTRRGRRRRWAVVAAALLATVGLLPAVWATARQPELAAVPVPPPPPPVVVGERPPETADEFFARGLRAVRAGKTTVALPDFHAAYNLSKNPRMLAFAAYCYALDRLPRYAVEMGRQAIHDGADSAELRNIVGFALTESSRHEEAIRDLDEALARSPHLQAALYNRAIARYRDTIAPGNDVRFTDPQCAADITAALAAGTTSADLHYYAAKIYAVSSGPDPGLRDAAIEQLRAAARAGKNPAGFRTEPVIQQYLTDQREFAVVCDLAPVRAADRPPQLRLAEPPLP
jgi:tetratricopeptide (TPR) repeat protein